MRSALIAALAVACSSPQTAPPPTPAPEPTPQPATPDSGHDEPDPTTPAEPDPPAATPESQIITEFVDIKNDMCSCADKTCAEQVNKSFEGWLDRHAKAKGSKQAQDQARKIAEDYTKCMIAAMTGGPAQGQQCAPNDRCADGLTCIKYYGVAGAAGPQLTSCEIPCGPGKPVCPTGQSCTIIADGPGQVCRS